MTSPLPPFIVAIPARLASTRLPRKPLRLLAGEALIRHVARRALASGANEVVVASEAPEVLAAVSDLEVATVLTRDSHASGTDRLAECADARGWPDEAVVVNLQGDEPFAPVEGIHACVRALVDSDAPMATLAAPLHETAEFLGPNCVKVVRDRDGLALYFSRAPIPCPRGTHLDGEGRLPDSVTALRHVGMYAYRAGFLRRFAALAPGELERTEMLEQLRALEHGHRIAVGLLTAAFPPGIDTLEDLERAERHLQRHPA